LSTSGVQLDGIINLAGIVGFGSATDTSASDAQKVMQVNHLGPSAVISALLPVLAKSENEPFILSISGVVAEKIFPGMSAYVTSKTAHSTWLKALNLEARRMKIRVIDARPGHTETGLASRAVFGTAPAFPQGMTPQHVVDTIVAAIVTGSNELASENF
jgi:cyclic-di-GMP-binding biofilm dispersal mediator protein